MLPERISLQLQEAKRYPTAVSFKSMHTYYVSRGQD